MKYVIILAVVLYIAMGITAFVMHTQMPGTLGLALLRSLFWPLWMAGGLRGSPLPMD